MSEAELSKIAIKGALDIAKKNFDMTHLEPNEKEQLKEACKKMWIWLKKNLWDKGWIFDKKKGKFMLGEFGEFGNLGAAVKYYALHAQNPDNMPDLVEGRKIITSFAFKLLAAAQKKKKELEKQKKAKEAEAEL